MEPLMNLKKLNVETVSSCSGIFHGQNNLHGFKGISIKNEGLGEVDGDHNSITNLKNMIINNDRT
ncbi:hypothetical protein GH741_17790 [Aquibacillus halophilus]|uniref:Uncharacterized protein n=1 Tax=Aquibacillus halophilus TaxID=930132 RepID=A0A6A8DGY5_9BACI|nr:hypothetical protein [Aquibacillus halophilus]MRH44500.1 hypothetical protein [Aquibacillus halophilus]